VAVRPRRTRYSDADKATALAVLAAEGGRVRRAARELGLAESVLRSWAKGRGAGPGVTHLCAQKKGDLADELERLALRLLESIPAKLGAASLKDCAVALGICVDKLVLLRRAGVA
jgi:transposase-like protein